MRENFLVLSFFEGYAEVGAFKADFASKEINLHTFLRGIKLRGKDFYDAHSSSEQAAGYSEEGVGINYLKTKKLALDTFHGLKNVLAIVFYPSPYKLILALDFERAFGIRQSISFSRDRPNEPLDMAELQNIVSQIVLKFFEENRRAGVKQLNLSEADLLLFDTKVYDCKLNGSRVIDPLGYSGEQIEIDLAQTFLDRNFYQGILSVLPKRAKLAWVTGAGIAASQSLSRIAPRKKIIFAKVLESRTDLFLARPAKQRKIVFWDCFKWGKRKFYGALAKNLRMEPNIAELLIRKYLEQETSRIFNRKFKQIISGELITLIRGLRHALKEAKADYVCLDFPPFGEQRRGLRSPQIFPKIIKLIDAAEIADSLGFKLNSRDSAPDILSLSPLIEFYFLPREDLINHLAKRRMRWLMANL